MSRLRGIVDKIIDEKIAAVLSGVNTIPPKSDTVWKDCTITTGSQGSVSVQARVVGGVVYLQGEIRHTYSSTGSYVEVARLPADIPPPATEIHFPIWGIDQGVAYRIALCRVLNTGAIQIAAPTGKVTTISLGNISYSAL